MDPITELSEATGISRIMAQGILHDLPRAGLHVVRTPVWTREPVDAALRATTPIVERWRLATIADDRVVEGAFHVPEFFTDDRRFREHEGTRIARAFANALLGQLMGGNPIELLEAART